MMQGLPSLQPSNPHFPEQEQLKCPRCESLNTKFCYYNNYNLSQPRHFCKNCKRYWTKGGTLRNIPVGGGTRKNAKRPPNTKLPSPSSSSSTPASHAQKSGFNPNPDSTMSMDEERRVVDGSGRFNSVSALNGHFGGFLAGITSNGSDAEMNLNSGLDRKARMEVQSSGDSKRYLSPQNGESSCWSNGSGWPDLAIFTPGSSFQ